MSDFIKQIKNLSDSDLLDSVPLSLLFSDNALESSDLLRIRQLSSAILDKSPKYCISLSHPTRVYPQFDSFFEYTWSENLFFKHLSEWSLLFGIVSHDTRFLELTPALQALCYLYSDPILWIGVYSFHDFSAIKSFRSADNESSSYLINSTDPEFTVLADYLTHQVISNVASFLVRDESDDFSEDDDFYDCVLRFKIPSDLKVFFSLDSVKTEADELQVSETFQYGDDHLTLCCSEIDDVLDDAFYAIFPYSADSNRSFSFDDESESFDYALSYHTQVECNVNRCPDLCSSSTSVMSGYSSTDSDDCEEFSSSLTLALGVGDDLSYDLTFFDESVCFSGCESDSDEIEILHKEQGAPIDYASVSEAYFEDDKTLEFEALSVVSFSNYQKFFLAQDVSPIVQFYCLQRLSFGFSVELLESIEQFGSQEHMLLRFPDLRPNSSTTSLEQLQLYRSFKERYDNAFVASEKVTRYRQFTILRNVALSNRILDSIKGLSDYYLKIKNQDLKPVSTIGSISKLLDGRLIVQLVLQERNSHVLNMIDKNFHRTYPSLWSVAPCTLTVAMLLRGDLKDFSLFPPSLVRFLSSSDGFDMFPALFYSSHALTTENSLVTSLTSFIGLEVIEDDDYGGLANPPE